jgi:serine phosphatase RsbU (regulator of sigma subunit)
LIVRILIVDDLEANRVLLSHLVELHDHIAITCANAEQALQAYNAHSIDLIFMDVVMPDIDGYVTAKQLKELIGDYFVPIIFITALQDEDALVRCLEFGDDYLVRPFNQMMFNAKIAVHIRTIDLHRKAQKQHQELTYLHTLLIQEQEMAQHVFDHATQVNYQNCENIKTYISSASQFNGDVLLIAKSPAGGVYVMLGDFTGHGLPAALGSLPLSQLFHALVLKQLSVGDLARELNSALADFLPDYMFCAAVIAEFNSSGDKMRLWSGGLHDSLILDEKFEIQQRISSLHMPLGILEDDAFNTKSIEFDLQATDKIIFYTDGILEASNERGELFGRERFEASLRRSKCDIEKMREGLHRFTGYQAGVSTQDDDISLVCINAGVITFKKGEHNASDQEAYESLRAPIPWEMSLKLGMTELRAGCPVSQLVDMVGEATGLYSHKPVLLLLLVELFNNALDHGVLGLASSVKDETDGLMKYYNERGKRLELYVEGHVGIQVSHQLLTEGGLLTFTVSDSGDGFDYERVVSSSAEESHGRGLSLVTRLCESLSFSDGGRRIDVVYAYTKD